MHVIPITFYSNMNYLDKQILIKFFPIIILQNTHSQHDHLASVLNRKRPQQVTIAGTYCKMPARHLASPKVFRGLTPLPPSRKPACPGKSRRKNNINHPWNASAL